MADEKKGSKKGDDAFNIDFGFGDLKLGGLFKGCLLYTSPSPRDGLLSRMPSSA